MTKQIPPVSFAQWKTLHPVVTRLHSDDTLIELYARYREAYAVACHFNNPRKPSWFAKWFQGNRSVLDQYRYSAPPTIDASELADTSILPTVLEERT